MIVNAESVRRGWRLLADGFMRERRRGSILQEAYRVENRGVLSMLQTSMQFAQRAAF